MESAPILSSLMLLCSPTLLVCLHTMWGGPACHEEGNPYSTGLYKFGTRYYNPGFGRWSQQDPLRGQLNDPTSLNRYLYASDDPVNFTDPSGRGDILACAEAIALVFLTFVGGIAAIIAVIIVLPVDAVGLVLLAAYLGISVGATGVIIGEITAFMTYTSGVCDFSQ